MKKSIFSLLLISYTLLFSQETNIIDKKENNNTLSLESSEIEFETITISSSEAFEKMSLNKEIFLIDIRSPQKIKLIGNIIDTDLFISYENFNPKNYKFEQNKYFYDELKYELITKNIDFDKELMIIDNYDDNILRKISKHLNELGFQKIYIINDGFEGSKAKFGKFKNQRVVSGWKNKNNNWELSEYKKIFWSPCKYSFLFEEEDKLKCEDKILECPQLENNSTLPSMPENKDYFNKDETEELIKILNKTR